MSEGLTALAQDLGPILRSLPRFGSFVQIKNVVAKTVTDFSWDRWHPEQRRFEAERTGRDLVLKGRQMGFSTVELARDLMYARTHEAARVQIVIHDREEKPAYLKRLHDMAERFYDYGLAPKPQYSTKTEIVWSDNGSGVYITEAGVSDNAAQKTGRSGTIDRLHATEAAFWGAPEEAWAALEMATEHGDEVVIESTANGADEWFHQIWLAAVEGRFSGFKPHFYPWFEHPNRTAELGVYAPATSSRERRWEERLVDELGITEHQLAWWRKGVQSVGLDRMLREQPPTPEAAFQSSGDTWIDAEWLDELDRHTRHPMRLMKLRRGELRVYADPEPGEHYVLAADVSEGGGGDEAAFVVLHHRSGDVVAAWDDQHTSPKDLARLMCEVGDLYNRALLAPEISGMRTEGREPIGLVTLREIKDSGYRNVYQHDTVETGDRRKRRVKREGWPTDKKTRPVLLEDMKDGIERREIQSPDRKMVAEARALVRDRSGHVQARGKRSGGSDDGLFFAWAIAHQVRQRARIRRPGTGRIESVATLTSADFRT